MDVVNDLSLIDGESKGQSLSKSLISFRVKGVGSVGYVIPQSDSDCGLPLCLLHELGIGQLSLLHL